MFLNSYIKYNEFPLSMRFIKTCPITLNRSLKYSLLYFVCILRPPPPPPPPDSSRACEIIKKQLIASPLFGPIVAHIQTVVLSFTHLNVLAHSFSYWITCLLKVSKKNSLLDSHQSCLFCKPQVCTTVAQISLLLYFNVIRCACLWHQTKHYCFYFYSAFLFFILF